MNQTHIHLLINHLPIIGSVLGALVLIHGMGVKSNQTMIAAYYIFVLCALGAAIAYLTGEAAEESIENIQGIVKSTIEPHEEFALYALVSLIVLGLASIAGLYFTWKDSPHTKNTSYVILFISIVSFALVARTGYLGGLIRHTELTSKQAPSYENTEADDD
jgi:uncharacterized membrane protein